MSALREYVLIAPRTDNAGADLASEHVAFTDHLLSRYGGYTHTPVTGAWRDEDTGVVYHDHSIEYRSATDSQAAWLETARYARRLLRQLAIYVRCPNGRAIFVADGQSSLGFAILAAIFVAVVMLAASHHVALMGALCLSPVALDMRKRTQHDAYHAAMLANTLAAYDAATASERAVGAVWTKTLAQSITAYAGHYSVPSDQAVALFAALSPTRSLADNWLMFRRVLVGNRFGCTRFQSRRCRAIMRGDNIYDAVTGHKVVALMSALAGDVNAVCVDRHVASILVGQPWRGRGIGSARYAAMVTTVRVAASERGITPDAMRATIRIVRLRSLGRW